MNRKEYFKIHRYFILMLVLVINILPIEAKTNFPNIETETFVKRGNIFDFNLEDKKANDNTFHFLEKDKTKYQNKPEKERKKFFGLLAVWSLVAAFFVAVSLSFTTIGPIIATLLFIASCIFAFYGTSKDKYKRLARLTLIIDLIISLTTLFVFWIITLISL
jgi:amino acid permease